MITIISFFVSSSISQVERHTLEIWTHHWHDLVDMTIDDCRALSVDERICFIYRYTKVRHLPRPFAHALWREIKCKGGIAESINRLHSMAAVRVVMRAFVNAVAHDRSR